MQTPPKFWEHSHPKSLKYTKADRIRWQGTHDLRFHCSGMMFWVRSRWIGVFGHEEGLAACTSCLDSTPKRKASKSRNIAKPKARHKGHPAEVSLRDRTQSCCITAMALVSTQLSATAAPPSSPYENHVHKEFGKGLLPPTVPDIKLFAPKTSIAGAFTWIQIGQAGGLKTRPGLGHGRSPKKVTMARRLGSPGGQRRWDKGPLQPSQASGDTRRNKARKHTWQVFSVQLIYIS